MIHADFKSEVGLLRRKSRKVFKEGILGVFRESLFRFEPEKPSNAGRPVRKPKSANDTTARDELSKFWFKNPCRSNRRRFGSPAVALFRDDNDAKR